jgi:hypothetical protein
MSVSDPAIGASVTCPLDQSLTCLSARVISG